ncbi:arginine deiminase-related protein [Marilutibacter aestuarii]|uniref:Amidinotransferase n=1 Tax=Marilutibacter aestuarii TaxID=1706195 RepID=A0A508AMB4_9GAMM|nr:arginine deiminase-related protein [Lysobacter aestuarii]TQD50939.1 amidinotransferase [Lysobacter aestuarii]
MITRDPGAFLALARGCGPDFGPATARAAFLVAPEGFRRAEQSALDNAYMAEAPAFEPERALAQHRALHAALAASCPVLCFPGDPDTPDAVFPNNAFASAPGRLLVGRMRHPVRQRETAREDIRRFFGEVLGARTIDLSGQPHPCELTGSLVIDRARGLGYCGLSERCDEDGARLMHEAFGLRTTLVFDLAPGEYHANVVMSVLAGRCVLLCEDGFASPTAAAAIADLYAPHAIRLSAAERQGFVANCLALDAGTVWMSARAGRALDPLNRAALGRAGFVVREVPLDAIEAAGGSLRCCVGEIF